MARCLENRSEPLPVVLMQPYFWKTFNGSEWSDTNNYLILLELCHDSHI